MKAMRIIGVIGGGQVGPAVEAQAEATGRAIAEAGAALICGGLGGVMAAACRGAQEAGGLTLGVLSGSDRADANPWVTVPIVTGMGQARNVIIARTADVLVAIDGSYGTLSEIAFGLQFGKPIIGLGTWRLDVTPDPLVRAGDPTEAVRLALEALDALDAG